MWYDNDDGDDGDGFNGSVIRLRAHNPVIDLHAQKLENASKVKEESKVYRELQKCHVFPCTRKGLEVKHGNRVDVFIFSPFH